MSIARRRLPFGAERIDDARTRFRLWAPSASRVDVVIGGTPHAMTHEAGGWYEIVAPAPHGTRYRYRIDGKLDVPDPASRAQDGGIDGESIVVDPAAYRWRVPQGSGRRWSDAVIYELHVGLYGGFAGVEAKLDDLAALGITAIELMPIAQFPGTRNWGYDGVLPFAPAASYGTPDALKSLVDAAHERGLMVLLDVVYNHFGPEGNYLGAYAGPFFDATKQTPWGAAIDFSRPEVRQFFLENAQYWLDEFRIDGLRLDAVHAIGDASFVAELVERITSRHADGAPRHAILENEENDAALLAGPHAAQWNDDAHHVLHVLLSGERDGYYADYAERATAHLARWLAEGFVFQGEPMAYREGRARGSPSASLAPTVFVNALQNHDQIGNRALGDRLIEAADARALDAAYALLLLNPQIPMLFMGEDWGSRVPFLYFTDYSGELAAAVRDGRRREFTRFAAFAATDIPDPNAISTFEASRPDFPRADNAFRARIRELIALRRTHVTPRLVDARSLGCRIVGDAAVDARWRMGDGRVLRIAVNFGTAEAPIDDIGTAPFFVSAGAITSATLAPATCAAWLLDAPA
ncbi:MAG: malto-oligosyltrehalose trehalohydrolase [Rhodanobacteraceae bacterium]